MQSGILTILITGVGGQGTLTLSRVIGEAAIMQGYNIVIGETLGMSQRGGSVVSFIRIAIRDKTIDTLSPVPPYASADLIIGLELLETLRIVDRYSSSNKTVILLEQYSRNTITTQLGLETYPSIDYILDRVRSRCRKLVITYLSKLLKQFNAIRSLNICLLGIASRLGFIPISIDNLRKAIVKIFPKEIAEENLSIFDEIVDRGTIRGIAVEIKEL